MKKGIALFSTLIVLIVVISLMSLSLGSVTSIKKNILLDKQIIQENLIVNDLKEILEKKVLAQINLKGSVEQVHLYQKIFKNPITIINEVDNSNIEMSITSHSGKVNFNRLIKNINMTTFRNKFLTKLHIMDIELFREIYETNLNADPTSNETYKLSYYNPDHIEGRDIRSFQEFFEILDIYIKFSGDKNVKNIPWQNYIKFTGETLDINYMDMILIDSLPVAFSFQLRQKLQNDKQVIESLEQLNVSEKEKTILSQLKVGVLSSELLCKINIKSINSKVEYGFIYNLSSNNKVYDISVDRWVY